MYIVANDDPFVRDQILDYLLKVWIWIYTKSIAKLNKKIISAPTN